MTLIPNIATCPVKYVSLTFIFGSYQINFISISFNFSLIFCNTSINVAMFWKLYCNMDGLSWSILITVTKRPLTSVGLFGWPEKWKIRMLTKATFPHQSSARWDPIEILLGWPGLKIFILCSHLFSQWQCQKQSPLKL